MDEPREPLLDVRGVRVAFGAMLAVNDLSLQLHHGDLLGLIGPNGAGKTTLLRAIAGLQAYVTGRVQVYGQRVDPFSGRGMEHIGFTPDTPPAYEEMSVRDFLRFIAHGYDLRGLEVEEKIGFWLEQVWLTEKADQKIKSLSRGMRQRLGIARTLVPDPSVILLDEPAAGLDPAGRVQFRQLLVALRNQGKALIVSSHILADMGEYCSHIAIMGKGRLLRMGTVQQIASGEATHDREYAITLAREVPGTRERLEAVEGVHSARGERLRWTIRAAAGEESAAGVLASLVGGGLPVASFAPVSHDLEAAYLREGIQQVD